MLLAAEPDHEFDLVTRHTICGVGADAAALGEAVPEVLLRTAGMRIFVESMDQLCRRPGLVVVDLVIPITKNTKPKT
jgi:hypothetical protein